MPFLKSLVERHNNEPFAILGINTDDSKEEYLEKKESFGVTWRSAWQGGMGGEEGIPARWAVNSFPTKFILDAKGVIRYTSDQLRTEHAIEAAIAKLLAEANAK